MRMKKLFTLCAAALLGIGAFAQVDETFQFVDADGNVVTDGTVITVSERNEAGQMVVPLYVKNASGQKAAVSMYETIDAKPNGEWQTCAFGNCMTLDETGYSPKNIMAADYNADIQTEWIPEEGGYATWEATLQIHVFNIVSRMQFGQVIEQPGDEIIGYGPKVTVRFEYKDPDAPQGQQLWWGYVGENDEVSAVGVAAAETYDCASFFSGSNEVAADKTIHAIRFALYSQNVKDIKVWIADKLPTTIDADNVIELVDVETVTPGVYEVQLPTPYKIGDKGVYVGYTFTITNVQYQSDAYPICIAGSDLANTLLVRTSASVTSWSDLNGQGFGRLYLQLLLEGEFPYQNAASFTYSDIGEYVAATNGTATAYLPLTNEGTEPLTSIDYTITADGVTGAEQHLDLQNPISLSGTTIATITVNGDDEAGTKRKTVTITKVNGVANEYETAQTQYTMATVTKLVDRVIAVEEFTGTTCGWCPRGLVGMEKIRNTFGDKTVGIAIHRYTTSTANDAMYISTYNHVSFGGAPSCRINRGAVIDPYYGTGSSIINDISNELTIPAKAAISVTGAWSEDGKKVNAEATIESVLPGSSFKIEYVLVADGLTGTTQAWRQHNYYHPAYGNFSSASQLPEDLQFLFNTGEIFNNQYVAYYPTFNDVAIAVGKSTQTTAPGLLNVGEAVTNSYTLTMPTNTALLNAIQTDKVSVVALLIGSDGTITNAAKFQLPEYQDPSGVSAVKMGDDTTPQQHYSIDGRLLQGQQKGLNIVRMSDGTVRKVVVK